MQVGPIGKKMERAEKGEEKGERTDRWIKTERKKIERKDLAQTYSERQIQAKES